MSATADEIEAAFTAAVAYIRHLEEQNQHLLDQLETRDNDQTQEPEE